MLKQLNPFLTTKGYNSISPAGYDKLLAIVGYISRRELLPEDLKCPFSSLLIEHSTILDTCGDSKFRSRYFKYVISSLNQLKVIVSILYPW